MYTGRLEAWKSFEGTKTKKGKVILPGFEPGASKNVPYLTQETTPGGYDFAFCFFYHPGWFPVVGWYLTYPGDGHDLFEFSFLSPGVVSGGGDSSTTGNIWYT